MTRAARSSGRADAILCHSPAIFSPTRGRPRTQAGTPGTESSASDLDQTTMASPCSTTVTTPTATGATTIMSIVTVITATARPRLPQSRAWTARSAGQVATTIMVAQTVASRKGRSTQKLAAIKPPIATTASRIRVRSQDGGAEDPASALIPAIRRRAPCRAGRRPAARRAGCGPAPARRRRAGARSPGPPGTCVTPPV